MGRSFTANQHKFDNIVSSINNKEDISENLRSFEMEYLSGFVLRNLKFLMRLQSRRIANGWLPMILCYRVITDVSRNKEDIPSAFQREREIFKAKNAKYYEVFDEIENALFKGEAPSMKNLYSLCSCMQLN